MSSGRPKILLGVTVDISLRLLNGFPAYLVSTGWDVHVVSSPGPALDGLKGVEGVTTHAVAMAREPSPVSDLRSLLHWIRLLRRLRPDVLSVGTPKAGLLGALAGRLTGVPSRVYLLRGLRLETAEGFRRVIFTVLERVAAACANVVVVVSPSLRRRALDLRLAKPEKMVLIGSGSSNGIDVDAYQNADHSAAVLVKLADRLGLQEGVPVVGFVGRLTKDKGVDVLANARVLLAARGIDHQLLVVGGADSASAEASLSAEGSDLRPAIVTGQVSDPETYYRVMDVLCLPSLREGFPNVVLEASASGIPTVTTDATGAIDSVIPGETGLISKAGSAESLAEQLSVLLTDPELSSRMGRAAATFVREKFDRPTVWRLNEEFLSRMLESYGRSKAGTN